jgi:hypothetical protein
LRDLQVTKPDGSPAAALPSLGAVMSARTGTIEAPPRGIRAALKAALIVIVTVASGAATFALVSATSGSHREASGSAGSAVELALGSGPAADAPIGAPIDAPIDAPADAPADAPVDEVGRDAGRAGAEGASTTPQAQPVARKYGRLEVRAFPVLTVTVGGKPMGDTPVNTRILVGKHTLRLTNSATGYAEKVPIEILENTTTTIERMK